MAEGGLRPELQTYYHYLAELSECQTAFSMFIFRYETNATPSLREASLFMNDDECTDSWLLRVPRISDGWMLNSNQNVYTITIPKVSVSSWKRERKECRSWKKGRRTLKFHLLGMIPPMQLSPHSTLVACNRPS